MKNDSLKIAMISVHSSPTGKVGTRATGGMSIYLVEVARRLAAMGHAVDIFTRIQQTGHPQKVGLFPSVRLIHLEAGPSCPLEQQVLHRHLPEFFEKLDRFKERENAAYDLLHSHYWLSGQIGRWASRRWNIPHVFNYHTLGALKNRIAGLEKEPEVRITLEKELALESDLILAGTARERHHIIDCYGAMRQRVRVVPCGVDLKLFRPSQKPRSVSCSRLLHRERVILYVGRFDPIKGVDRLLASLARLRQEIPLRLILVGGGEDHSSDVRTLRSLCSDLSLTDCVTFAGSKSHDDLPHFYRAADALVLPSYYESFGLVVLEALACGTPVVATHVGVVDDIVRNGVNGWVTEDNTPEKLAEGIRNTLQMHTSHGAGAASVRATVEDYDWTLVASAVDKEYRSLRQIDGAGRDMRVFSYCPDCSKGVHPRPAHGSLRGLVNDREAS